MIDRTHQSGGPIVRATTAQALGTSQPSVTPGLSTPIQPFPSHTTARGLPQTQAGKHTHPLLLQYFNDVPPSSEPVERIALPEDHPGKRISLNLREFFAGGRQMLAIGCLEGPEGVAYNSLEPVLHILERADGAYERIAKVPVPTEPGVWYGAFSGLAVLPHDNGSATLVTAFANQFHRVDVSASGVVSTAQSTELSGGSAVVGALGKSNQHRLITFDPSTGEVTLSSPRADGTLQADHKVVVPVFSNMGFECMTLADLDGDGEQELLLSNGSLVKERAPGQWEVTSVAHMMHANAQVAVGDVDGDGTDEIIIVDSTPYIDFPADLVIYKGDVTNGFQVWKTFVQGTQENHPQDVMVADLDGDGRAEIYVPPQEGGGMKIFRIDDTAELVMTHVDVSPAQGAFVARRSGNKVLVCNDRGAVRIDAAAILGAKLDPEEPDREVQQS